MPKTDEERRARYRLHNARWRTRHPERAAEHNRNGRWRGILKRHGMTQEDYDRLLESQDGVCAICGGDPIPPKRYLSIDHDHETGRVRGLLCDNCNRALGLLKDKAEVVAAADAYLRGWYE